VTVAGLLLAAGAGRRMGRPKALLRDRVGVSFLDRGVASLREGGCGTVTVVLGAQADEARALLTPSAAAALTVVVAADWHEGMGASLRAGLAALQGATADAVLVTLVDLPDVGGDVVRRVVAAGAGADALVRASYDGRPGHPVLLGRGHWAGIAAVARGDQGAREYFRAHPPMPCECGDLASGRDVDRPEDL
jgi:molybdenum cofactor cytidylyltransferase/nicotine blue oxidoreductase